jgi:hypothetical protein
MSDARPALTARLSPSDIRRLFPVELIDVDPLAAAEPSRAALIRLETGRLVVIEYGTMTSTLTVSVPRDEDLSETLAELLAEAPIASPAIEWTALAPTGARHASS